jgi:hypothetical protein
MYSKLTFNNYLSIIVAFIFLVSLNSCSLLSGFQDGRSLGKNRVEGLVAASSTIIKSNDEIDSRKSQSGSVLGLPSLEMGLKYGVTEKMDVFLRVNTAFSIAGGFKYQILGDRSSKFAIGTGFDYSILAFGPLSGQSTQIPLYASVHPTKEFSFYCSPRAIFYRNKTDFLGFRTETSINTIGFNAGILLGEKDKFGFDLGYALGYISLGIGGKFLFSRQ